MSIEDLRADAEVLNFDEQDIRNALKKAKTGKSSRLNNISMELIKLFADADIEFFVEAANFEINSIESPPEFLNARMVPIVKPGLPGTHVSEFRCLTMIDHLQKY